MFCVSLVNFLCLFLKFCCKVHFEAKIPRLRDYIMGANRIVLSTLLLALTIIATTFAPIQAQNGSDKSEFKGSPEKILQLANDLYRAQRFAKAKEAYVKCSRRMLAITSPPCGLPSAVTSSKSMMMPLASLKAPLTSTKKAMTLSILSLVSP